MFAVHPESLVNFWMIGVTDGGVSDEVRVDATAGAVVVNVVPPTTFVAADLIVVAVDDEDDDEDDADDSCCGSEVVSHFAPDIF